MFFSLFLSLANSSLLGGGGGKFDFLFSSTCMVSKQNRIIRFFRRFGEWREMSKCVTAVIIAVSPLVNWLCRLNVLSFLKSSLITWKKNSSLRRNGRGRAGGVSHWVCLCWLLYHFCSEVASKNLSASLFVFLAILLLVNSEARNSLAHSDVTPNIAQRYTKHFPPSFSLSWFLTQHYNPEGVWESTVGRGNIKLNFGMSNTNLTSLKEKNNMGGSKNVRNKTKVLEWKFSYVQVQFKVL